MRRKILCSLFGHYRAKGWYGDGLYGKVREAGHDNIGRIHATISAECDRCGENYLLARFHITNPVIVDALAKRDAPPERRDDGRPCRG